MQNRSTFGANYQCHSNITAFGSVRRKLEAYYYCLAKCYSYSMNLLKMQCDTAVNEMLVAVLSDVLLYYPISWQVSLTCHTKTTQFGQFSNFHLFTLLMMKLKNILFPDLVQSNSHSIFYPITKVCCISLDLYPLHSICFCMEFSSTFQILFLFVYLLAFK